ncbi:9696_t:CDS:2, partial [Acaulospora morrowiae]
LYNFARNFSEDTNTNKHQIDFNNNTICSHCNALKLPTESPGMCCSNGKVLLAEPNVPLILQHFFSGQNNITKDFLNKIRLYNSAFTFASVGVMFDRDLANARAGIYTFRVQGSFHHRIGSLLPEHSSEPHYLQMYIYDTQHELQHRINAIPNSNLNLDIVQALKIMFDEVNPYVINFRYISDLPAKDIENLSILIHADISGLDQRTHNAPTAPQVAAIWIDSDVSSNVIQKRDIILHTQMNQLIRISEFSGCYDPLAYPLLFPHGEQGWAPRQIPYRDVSLAPETIDINEDNNEEYENSNTNIRRHRKFNKFQELKKDLFERGVFGRVIAHIYVIEFQKRGLPHAHIL